MTRVERTILPLSSKMRQARLKENCGMLSHIMWRTPSWSRRSRSGRREIYNNTPQVSWPCGCSQSGELSNPADFKKKPPVNPVDLKGLPIGDDFQVRKSSSWQRVVRALYSKYDKESLLYPAPKPITTMLWDRLSLSHSEAAQRNQDSLCLVVTVVGDLSG